MSLLHNVSTQTLSTTESAIYHYIMNHLETVPYMRVREIAVNSHTSSASVMRFIHKIGYESFPEFKVDIKRKHTSGKNQLSYSDFFEEITKLLAPSAFSHDFEKKIALLASKISECENLVFVGIGLSGVMANYAALRIATLGVNCFAVIDPYYPLAARLRHTSDNLLVTISNSGESKDIIKMMTYFQPLPDYELITITGNPESQLARMSSIVFPHTFTPERNLGYYDTSSQLPTMFIIERLIRELENVLPLY